MLTGHPDFDCSFRFEDTVDVATRSNAVIAVIERLSLWSFEIVCVLSIEGTSQVFVDFVWRRVGKKGKKGKDGGIDLSTAVFSDQYQGDGKSGQRPALR